MVLAVIEGAVVVEGELTTSGMVFSATWPLYATLTVIVPVPLTGPEENFAILPAPYGATEPIDVDHVYEANSFATTFAVPRPVITVNSAGLLVGPNQFCGATFKMDSVKKVGLKVVTGVALVRHVRSPD